MNAAGSKKADISPSDTGECQADQEVLFPPEGAFAITIVMWSVWHLISACLN
ncbi:hypothetical protein GTPT_1268 [Tatumella ptyseos ATCC 33301]|uniref:Uncharacterized protein n=1 Tax=Tatumella ptyseos ATCC 33301 TaxID=1005995 RepID=A0A085JJ26_9GAMM|nr:hypothetical protein GTPT_1268 [Tatumella ptyseos ATCC 33301]